MIAYFGWWDDCATDVCRRSVGTGDVNLSKELKILMTLHVHYSTVQFCAVLRCFALFSVAVSVVFVCIVFCFILLCRVVFCCLALRHKLGELQINFPLFFVPKIHLKTSYPKFNSEKVYQDEVFYYKDASYFFLEYDPNITNTIALYVGLRNLEPFLKFLFEGYFRKFKDVCFNCRESYIIILPIGILTPTLHSFA